MNLIIDIGHPGHVHYFRNLYLKMITYGHDILVVARDKEVTFELLRYYKIPFVSRGKGKKSFIGKLTYLFYSSFLIFRKGFKFKPDVIISFASPYASLASFMLRCTNIVLDDTEVGRFERLIYKPNADLILTPNVFKENIGNKQVRFNGFMELSYLSSAYFHPDRSVINDLGLVDNEKYIIIRFVSWEASHDKGQKGLSIQQKHEIIDLCNKSVRIFISSEQKLPDSLEKFRLKLKPHQLHDALFFASMYIGEGATTASEACLLGTPAVYINTITAGTIEEQEKQGLLFHFFDFSGVLEQIDKILSSGFKSYYQLKSKELISGKIDLTSFLIWLTENSPNSIKSILKDRNLQYQFKIQ